VRSVTGALLAGMIFAIAPTRLSIILILIFFLVVGGLFTQLALNRAYRNVFGAMAMLVLAVIAFGGSGWIWDNVNNADAVSTILVLLGLAAGALLARRMMKLPIAHRGVQIALAVVAAALGIWAAIVLGGLDLGDSATEVPTILFGLGAIGLGSEPRGVIYDIINRQRLRQFQEAERRDEEARRQADEALLPAGVPG
jgi:signal transduction histidine kinase